jgi:hypothetical protein
VCRAPSHRGAQGDRTRRSRSVTTPTCKPSPTGSWKSSPTVGFRCGSRGWCYILEEEAGLTKADFDDEQKAMVECRKRCLIPINFFVEDEGRAADGLEDLDIDSPRHFCDSYARVARDCWKEYTPISFWDYQSVYIEIFVEKIDLKTLFLPVCQEFKVAISNIQGGIDLNQRALAMLRFKKWEAKGKRIILLYCGDFDPPGVLISTCLMRNFAELEHATMRDEDGDVTPIDWSPRNMVIDRFGLNKDFIMANRLSWTHNLITSSGKDLADRNHPNHDDAYVQDWLRDVGVRKCEANALVTRPDAGRDLCRRAILKYLDKKGVREYERELERRRQEVRGLMPEFLRDAAGTGKD